MLLNCDVKSLEVVVAAELSNDLVLKQELRDKLDLHSLNQARFKLPDRVTAKRLIFKILYGATAFGFSLDADFFDVKFSIRQWERVLDEFYNKYVGIAAWHRKIIQVVRDTQCLHIPSGRYYIFEPKQRRGELEWPITQIKNYPVQGFGADLVMLARIEFFQRLQESGLEGYMIQTVHDSLVVDTPSKNVYTISKMLRDSIEAVPSLCLKYFNYNFTLPLTCEIQVGPNKKDMVEFSFQEN